VERLKAKLDASCAQLCANEPYFTPNFQAARIILDGARAGNTGLRWASGAICGPLGCTCGDKGCLHQVCWRIYSHGRA
jgi:hypothetical protein